MDITTLYDLSDLKHTGFGQPRPRHGLNLLWWFAHNCVQIDSNGRIFAKCDPAKEVFGFEQFNNYEALLPNTGQKYYKVGSLKTPGSLRYHLPKYVTKKYTGHLDDSNKDRIIVSFDSSLNKFEKIYVTQHSDRTKFDQNHTYHISINLMQKINELKRKDFLKKTINHSHVSKDKHQSVLTNSCQSTSYEHMQDNQELHEDNHEEFLIEPFDYSIDMSELEQDKNICQSKKCCCALICCSLLILCIIVAVIVKMKI
ncbi:hypothetical protein QQF64_000594 [Cirrhinus molitorella]|uniref:Uncharacterized protein n=1 Tax=Cirrhinus molitorella TaxID=172907 RepID=A0ABR3NYB1_9TELE